jgi:hypothetical protein
LVHLTCRNINPPFAFVYPPPRVSFPSPSGIDPADPAFDILDACRAQADRAGGVLSVEPYTHCEERLADDELRALCHAGHVFSPNEYEVRAVPTLLFTSRYYTSTVCYV